MAVLIGGSVRINGMGIYDMSGNAGEWCEDIYADNVYSKHQRNNHINMSGGSNRVRRGGCWLDVPKIVRCSDREAFFLFVGMDLLGFCLVPP